MTSKQYVAALKKLGLTHASQEAANVLGITRRQSQRLADGERPVSKPIEKLLELLVHHGIPEEWRRG
jgi:hypothetical protein